MPKRILSQIAPGMVLEADVKDVSGRMLLKAGSEIREQHLKIFRTWGVSEVSIVGGEGAEESAEGTGAEQLDPEQLVRITRELEERFTHVDASHPAMRTLIKQVRDSMVRDALARSRG